MLRIVLFHFHGVEIASHVHHREYQSYCQAVLLTWQNIQYASLDDHYPKGIPSKVLRVLPFSTRQNRVGHLCLHLRQCVLRRVNHQDFVLTVCHKFQTLRRHSKHPRFFLDRRSPCQSGC